jgi:hypothetical protein
MRTWVEQADRQIVELTRQRDDLDEAIRDLRRMRDEAAESLS